ERPRPLMRLLPPADPYPLDALGSVLGAAAEAIHDYVQAPRAICCQSVLATAALAGQGHADVLLPTGQCRPLSLYLLAIAETGERKTSCDHEAAWPIARHEANLREKYDEDQLAYEDN